MKMMLAAIAMTIASPAVAQTAAPADAHAQHAQHAQHASQTGAADHAAHMEHANGHEGHDMAGGCCEKDADARMACCEKMKAEGKKMACCDKAAADAPAADPHAGHDMSQH